MTTQEFSNEFDVLINSYFVTGNYQISTPVDLDDYEKSVLLTKAQNDIVEQLYNGTLGIPFEGTEEARRYLNSLVKTVTMPATAAIRYIKGMEGYNFAFFGKDKPNPWFIVHETATLKMGNCQEREVAVVPVRLDELNRVLDNPFKGPSPNRVLRIEQGEQNVVIIPPKGGTIKAYTLKYIVKPNPIILVDLSSSKLSIDGKDYKTGCFLHEGLHRTILDRAVRLALNKIENSTPKTQEE